MDSRLLSEVRRELEPILSYRPGHAPNYGSGGAASGGGSGRVSGGCARALDAEWGPLNQDPLDAAPAKPTLDDSGLSPAISERLDRGTFARDLESLINRHSMENGSDTPDFILAGYLLACLRSWNAAMTAREGWYGRPIGDRGATFMVGG